MYRYFLDHMYNLLQKTTKQRKYIFFMGDFNLNLLIYDIHSEINDFINLMMTHYLSPHILHPTRVTDHSATIIDNIFTNITEFNSKSSNILCEITDHYPQFIIVEKNIVDYKSCSFAKRNFSFFNEGRDHSLTFGKVAQTPILKSVPPQFLSFIL